MKKIKLTFGWKYNSIEKRSDKETGKKQRSYTSSSHWWLGPQVKATGID